MEIFKEKSLNISKLPGLQAYINTPNPLEPEENKQPPREKSPPQCLSIMVLQLDSFLGCAQKKSFNHFN